MRQCDGTHQVFDTFYFKNTIESFAPELEDEDSLEKPCDSKRIRISYSHFESAETYECDYCDKTFSRKENLTRHIKVKNLCLFSISQCTLIHGYIKTPNTNFVFLLQSMPYDVKIGPH